MAKKAEDRRGTALYWLLIAAGFYYFVVAPRLEQGPQEVVYQKPTWTWSQQGRSRVRVMLGTDSVRFRHVQTYQADGVSVMCGEAQPRYKHYAGFGEFEEEVGEYQRFIAGGGVLALLEKKTDTAKFERMWAELCSQ